jgi:hypothetical protein
MEPARSAENMITFVSKYKIDPLARPGLIRQLSMCRIFALSNGEGAEFVMTNFVGALLQNQFTYIDGFFESGGRRAVSAKCIETSETTNVWTDNF